MPVATHEVTIYRLSETALDVDAFLETLTGTYLDETASGDLGFPEYLGAEALALHWAHPPAPAPWLKAAAHLIGPLPDDYRTHNCGALLLLQVDGDTYAIGFGGGWHAIPEQFKDNRFGLQFTIRAVDADRVRSVVRRALPGRRSTTMIDRV